MFVHSRPSVSFQAHRAAERRPILPDGGRGAALGGAEHARIVEGPGHGIARPDDANFSFWRNQQASGAKTTSAFDNLRAFEHAPAADRGPAFSSLHGGMGRLVENVMGQLIVFGVANPEKFPAHKMLPYYAERFTTVEINYTFYRMPNAKTIVGWDAETPAGFTFALKAPKRITHDARLKDVDEPLRYFLDTARALGPKLRGDMELDRLVALVQRDLDHRSISQVAVD